MQVPVLIEPMANNGFRAKAGGPLPLSAMGSTPDEALDNLREAMKQQLAQGIQLVAVDVPAQDNPWLAIAGIHDPNDPLIQEWKQEIAAYRQERDSDPDMP